MASSSSSSYSISSMVCFVILMVTLLPAESSSAQLSKDHYSESCPDVSAAIEPIVRSAISKEKRMGASLLRLFFHDCFVNVCNSSHARV